MFPTPDATPTVAVSAEPEEGVRDVHRQGDLIGRYVVLGDVGTGGMGRVYRAYDPKLQREVALKQLRARRLSDDAQARMLGEARAMAQLSHANVVAVYDVEVVDGAVTLAMELVPGKSLDRWLAEEHPWPETLAVLRAAGEGLAAAHAAGLVHRDFKPGNVLVSPDGAVKVTDFGIAKSTDDPGSAVEVPHQISNESLEVLDSLVAPVTHGDVVLGTPRYMAPEQHYGERADPRADQYAFCVAAWEALTGDPPFRRDTAAKLLAAKRSGPPPWPGPSAVPRRIVDALRRGLAHEAAERWPSMPELLDALDVQRGGSRRWVIGAAVVLAAAAVAGMVARAEPPAVCQGIAEGIDGVWNEARRSAIRTSLVDASETLGESTADRAIAQLDAYREEWIDVSRDACEAHNLRGDQSSDVMDLRMACLHRARTELDAAATVLTDADAEVVSDAHEVLGALPRLSRCSDVVALVADVAPPEDPRVAEVVHDARGRLARAKSLAAAGRYREAESTAAEVVALVAGTDYLPILAEADFQLGVVTARLGGGEEARETLHRAMSRALQAGDWGLGSRAAQELGALLGRHFVEYDEALRVGEVALALARRPAARPIEEASALSSLGATCSSAGDDARAEELLRHSVEILERVLGPDDVRLAGPLYDLAGVLRARGRYDEAQPLARRSLQLLVDNLGPDHPRVASGLAGVAILALEAGHYEEANRGLIEATEIFQRVFGPDDPRVARQLTNRAITQVQMGHYEEAVKLHRRALAIIEKKLGPEHPTVAAILFNLGVALSRLGADEEALAAQERALAIRERLPGPAAADSMVNVAAELMTLGRTEEALARVDGALKRYGETIGTDTPRAALAYARRAEALKALGRPDEALSDYRQAVAAIGDHGPSPDVLARVLFGAAQLTAERTDDRDEAVRLATRAREILADLPAHADTRAKIDAWLAEHGAGSH